MKNKVSVLVLILNWHFIHAQISEGGTPVSFSLDARTQEIPVIEMPAVDVPALLEEDTETDNMSGAFRFGYTHDVDIDIRKAGLQSVDVDAIMEQFSAGSQKKTDDIDVRLYDGQGNLLRQQKTKGGTVQMNVSGLPDGFYYLHIYDGVSDTPEMQQIVVEH